MVQQRLAAIKKKRLEKTNKLRQLGIDPYPHFFEKKYSCGEVRELLGKKVKTAGRIVASRIHGKIAFFDLTDYSGKIQLWFQENKLGKEKYDLIRLVDIGDFLGVEGEVAKTKTGEISIDITEFQVLSKAARPLPEKWHGLTDIEERYRKRYLDLLLNPKVRARFDLRDKLIKAIRRYLDNDGYFEVETPVLQPLYGGTNARPFKTHLNALKVDMYLRIADELYLKRLVIGGYDKIYEICKDFRNEGMDLSHNPEFTMIEFYEAYADYQRIMDVTEGLFKFLAKQLFDKEEMTVHGKKIDLSGKWPRVEMVTVLKKELGLDVLNLSQKELREYCQKHKLETRGNESKGELIYVIFDHLIPSRLIKPIWIVDYPIEVSPLAKKHRSKEGWVERFEGYIGGEEICDGWSEINDPADQRSRFEDEQKALRAGKEEAHPFDEDFLTAMEYGMPTLGGIGIGVDRLTMFFSDTWSIKEVILFPILRPKPVKKNEQK